MVHRRASAVVVSALGCSILFLSAPLAQNARDSAPTARQGTGVIAGRITVAGTPRLPVRRARVRLDSAALAQAQVTSTDTDGRYHFDALPPGSYRVKADKPGFVALFYGARHAPDTGSPIELKAGETATADVALTRGSAVEGRVVDGEGQPVANLVVSASRLAYTRYGRRPASVGQDITDDLGRFRVHSLPAGDYYIDAAPDPLRVVTQRDAPGPRPPGFARTFFPGSANVGEARQIALSAGRDAGGIDFVVTTVPLVRISGRVVPSTGKAASASVRIQAVGGPPGEVYGFMAPSDVDFMFPAVPPGDYWILARAVPSEGGDAEFAATRLSVSADVTNLRLTTEKGPAVRGRVEVDGAPTAVPPPGVQVRAEAAEFELPVPPGQPSALRVPVGADGLFSLDGVFGPRLFRLAGLPDGWALKSVWVGNGDVTDVVMDFRPGPPLPAIRIVVTDATGGLSGTVRRARNLPASRARVILFPDEARHWNARSRLIATTVTDSNGAFAFGSLLPGKYFLCAREYIDDGAWYDPEVLRDLRAVATPVTVAEHDKQTVTLTMKVLS